MSVVDWRNSPFDVYIGRHVWNGPPGIGPDLCIFGNPFVLNDVSDLEERANVIESYERWLMEPEQAPLVDKAKRELKGKVLACWCKPYDCHVDILRAVADETAEETERRRVKVSRKSFGNRNNSYAEYSPAEKTALVLDPDDKVNK